tara:strand:- start:1750 stop:2118 length:369 start_codon:yes stop_codon:yes gene_type:complete
LKKILNNIQLVFILILSGALILLLVLRPSTPIDTYEDELRELEEINKQLGVSNDSINLINIGLQKEIQNIIHEIDGTQIILQQTEEKLKKLENAKNEIPTFINNMDGDSITYYITEYLSRKN